MNKFLVYLLRILFLMLIGLLTYFIISTVVEGLITAMNAHTKSEIIESSYEDIDN